MLVNYEDLTMVTTTLPGAEQCNCFAVRSAARHVTQLYDQLLAPIGLRVTQFSILAKLKRRGPLTINALADDMVMDRTTLGRNILPLERDGLIDAQETSREGRRPERTVYSITAAGSELFHDWLRDLLGNPSREYPQFTAALSMVAHIRKTEIIEILEDRLDQMTERLKADKNARGQLAGVLPRIFMIESEYDQAVRQAEISWLRRTIDEIREGGYPWPAIADGKLTWDGDETFQVPDIPFEEWAERAKAKEADAKSAKGGRTRK